MALVYCTWSRFNLSLNVVVKFFVCNIWCQQIRHCNRSCEIVGGNHVLNSQSVFSSAVWRLLCKSGLLSRVVQSRHSVLFVIVGVNKLVTVIVLVK